MIQITEDKVYYDGVDITGGLAEYRIEKDAVSVARLVLVYHAPELDADIRTNGTVKGKADRDWDA